jgi:CBS domain containing-hemolysin-like protein
MRSKRWSLLDIVVVVLLILLNGLFAFAEFALLSSRRGQAPPPTG